MGATDNRRDDNGLLSALTARASDVDSGIIWIIYKSKSGELWFGGGPNGVFRFNGNSFERKY